MRMTAEGVSFIVDADYGLPVGGAAIGQAYPEMTADLLAGFSAPSADQDFTTDQWGTVMSGYAPVRDSTGNVIGIIGIDMDEADVTGRISFLNGIFLVISILAILAAIIGIVVIERRRSIDEELIVANRNYMKRVFESVQAGIMIIDAKTHMIVDANPTALALIGASKDQVAGRVCHTFLCPDEAGKCPLSDLGQAIDHAERTLVTLDGRRVPVINHAVPVVLDGSPRFLETFVDITDRKKAEEDLVAAVRKLKVLSVVTRNDIISDIYALAGYLELIKEETPGFATSPLAEKVEWVMERIRLKSAFFRDYDDAGTKEPVWQDIGGMVDVAADRLKTGQLAIRVTCSGYEVYADPLLYKVFSSLIDNTLRHGMHVTEVRISCATRGRNLILTYEDNGIGIGIDDKERIFERGVGTSTGLGLFLAREVLGNTGLTIHETGEQGKGARFEITIPEGKYRLVTDRGVPPKDR
jgi:PAS domain S-box-containing protein